jgi:hypothetical protein
VSQHVVRYEGEGKARRPVYADEGPASAAASDPMAMHSRLAVPGMAARGGAGPIERREATAAQREAWRTEATDPPVRRSIDDLPTATAWRPERPTPPTPEEEPAVSEPRTDYSESIHEPGDEQPVALDRARLSDPALTRPLEQLAAAGGGPVGDEVSRLTAFQRRALEATVRLRGDRRAVADELGVKAYQSVDNALEEVGRKGLLPITLIPLLPARFAKYQGV